MSNPTSCFVKKKKKNNNNNNRKAMKWQLFITLFSLIGCTAWNTTIWPLLLWLKAILPGFFPSEPRFRFQNGGCMKSAYWAATRPIWQHWSWSFTHWSVIVATFQLPETWRWTKRTVIGCLICRSNGLMGGPWLMSTAIYSRPSAISLKVWLRKTSLEVEKGQWVWQHTAGIQEFNGILIWVECDCTV